MRSYTNRKGEVVTVNKEHLDIAVKIKKELQNSSPSRKCNWHLHKRLMEKEGFNDSDVNEQYRCLIKDYQKSIGELPQLEKYADMVASSKLESIKELVGEIAYEKRETQHVLRELNKVKREVIDYTLIAEQIGQALKSYNWSEFKFEYKPLSNSSNKMIVALSDLHIGALVDSDINTYNYEVAKYRMQQYLNRVRKEIEINNVSEVYLINLGDSIEHPYMHNLAYNSEFSWTEQVAKASDLIIKFMIGLVENNSITLRVAGIGGNHDRFHDDKNKSLDGDHAVKMINDNIKSFIENSNIERITYEQAKDYEHSISINGLNVKFLHGDLDNINDQNTIAKHCSLDGVDYSLILMGHYHHHSIKEVGINKAVVGFGSLKGADGYSEKNRRISSPSQGFVLIDENGNYEIRSVKLK